MSANEEKIAELQRQRDEELSKIERRMGQSQQMKDDLRRAQDSLTERYERMVGEVSDD